MIELLFIRHGATAGNLERRYIGRTDEPLCETGVAQVLRLRESLPSAERVFVSPLRRAVQTAELLYPGLPRTVVEALAETDFGIFEGKTADELSATPAYREWLEGMCLGPIPGGEDVSAFKARCRAAFGAVIREAPEDSRAAIVAHGGVIMAILEAHAVPRRDFYAYHIGNGAYLRGVCDGESVRLL